METYLSAFLYAIQVCGSAVLYHGMKRHATSVEEKVHGKYNSIRKLHVHTAQRF